MLNKKYYFLSCLPLLVILISSFCLTSFTANWILSKSNKLNPELWTLKVPFKETVSHQYGKNYTQLNHGNLVLANNASLILNDDILTNSKSLLAEIRCRFLSEPERLLSDPEIDICLRNDLIFQYSAKQCNFLRLSENDSTIPVIHGGFYDKRDLKNNHRITTITLDAKNGDISYLKNGRRILNTPDAGDYRFFSREPLLPAQIMSVRLKISYKDGRKDRIINEEFLNPMTGVYKAGLFFSLFALFLITHYLLLYIDPPPAAEMFPEKHYLMIKSAAALPFLSSLYLILDLNYLTFVNMGLYFLSLQEIRILFYYLFFLITDGIVRLLSFSCGKKTNIGKPIPAAYFLLIISGLATGRWQNLFYIPLMTAIIALAAGIFSYMSKTPWKQTFADMISLPVKSSVLFTIIINTAFYFNPSMHPFHAYYLLLPILIYYLCIYAVLNRKSIRYGQLVIIISILLLLISLEVSVMKTVPARAMGLRLEPYVPDRYTFWIRKGLLGPGQMDNYYLTKTSFDKEYKKIICFGGSSTEGGVQMYMHGLRYDFPYQMNAALRAKGYTVLNFGVGGWTTFNIKNYLKYHIDVIDMINPRAAVFYIGVNDIKYMMGSITAERLWIRQNNENKIIRYLKLLLTQSNIYSFIGRTVSEIKKGSILLQSKNLVSAVSLDEANDNIIEIIKILGKRNIKVIFVTEIESSLFDRGMDDNNPMLSYNKQLKRKADSRYVFFIDVTDYFRRFRKENILYDYVHLTEKGNKLLADYIVNYLTENGIVE